MSPNLEYPFFLTVLERILCHLFMGKNYKFPQSTKEVQVHKKLVKILTKGMIEVKKCKFHNVIVCLDHSHI